jgi:hypothetical protein
MPKAVQARRAGAIGTVAYKGKRTRTGNSSGFRFEGALFKSHPEFDGEVTAHVIAPGRMLVTAELESREKEDPVLSAFLAFLAQDMKRNPDSIRPLDETRQKRIERLTKGIVVNLDEDLGEESLL